MAVSSQTGGFGALKRLRGCALVPCLLAAPFLSAATIQEGDVTSSLGPTFFVDDTTLGGSDIDIGHNTTASFIRLFNGQLTPNQGPTRVVLTGFGFATHTSTTTNDATTINVAFTYLGADEVVGGGDDIPIGNATGDFVFSGGKEYTFPFDSPLTADLNITGTRFHIQVTPVNANHTALPDTALKLKTGALASEPSVSGPKVSVAGLSRPLISPGRVNLAKFQPVTATSTAGQRLASYLTDGVAGNDNRWQGSGSTWQSAVIDFPFPVEVGSAQVFTGVDDTNPIATYVVQFWNGTAWTNIDGANVSGNTSTERNLVFTNPVTASSFRFLGPESNLRVKELALYAPNGPTGFPLGTDVTLNLACGRPAVASASTPGNFALKAVDGRAHTGSVWQTATAGVNTLDIDLRVSTRIGSAHLYSGAGTIPPLADFVLEFWNGSSWQNIPGGTVTGNSTADLVISFTPVTTSQIRLEFTNPGTTSIRELCVFPANAGNSGYPIGTHIINSGAFAGHETYNDSFQLITNAGAGRSMSVPSGGQPALDPNGLTFGRNQYQLLLNHSTGTYRLRNRASAKCLSGAQLDKTPGLALLDAPYSAMPHQDWILDPMGGGNLRFINQWSGLAIDTQGGATAPGTLLVQNTVGNSSTQLWQISRHSWAPKKGIGHSLLSIPLGADWAYNWGRLLNQPLPADAPFFPMQWGNSNWDIGSAQGPLWQEYTRWRTRGDGVHLLGFNEPDRADQSNMSLSQVISAWPRLQELDLPLVSPAPGTASWLDSFHTQADALGYRVDATAVHTYPGPSGGNSDALHHFVNSAYTFNGRDRPVWLTEFSFVDWGKNQSWSEEDCYNCLAEFIWRAEGNDKLRKYALFIFTENSEWPQPANSWSAVSPAPRSNSYDAAGNMTAFGKLYAAWDSDTTIRTDKTYMVHNRGLRKRMANATTTNIAPGGRTIRTDGAIVNWTLVSAGATNRYYLVSSIDGRRLSYMANPTTNPNNDPTLAAPGTTGSAVEWTLTKSEHGWHYLDHPATNTRLKLVSYNTSNTVSDYQLVSSGTTDQNTQWRFIVPLPSNTAPSLAAIPPLTVNEGALLTFTASATDADLPPDPLAFSLIGAPSGATIHPGTGTFSWTPDQTQGPASYQFTIRVSDGILTHDQSVTVSVLEDGGSDVLDTWILSGQSNAEGYAITQNPVAGLTPSSTLATIGRNDLDVVHNNVRMFQGTTDLSSGITTSAGLSLPPRDTWHAATAYEGLAYDWGTGRGNESGRRFGPELAFGFDIQAMLASPIAIIKYARGNSSLAPSTAQSGGVWRDFDPSDGGRLNQYDKLVSTIQGAVDNLPAGQVLKVRGVLWMQGEGDATSSAFASAYQSNLAEFISSLRNDIGSIAASSGGRMSASAATWNQLDVFVGTILNTSANRQTVINAQNAVAAADPNVFTVNGTTGLSTLSVDDWGGSGIHYDTAGQILLGERFADAAISRIDSGVQVSETDASTSVTEGGAPDTYTISLIRAPSTDVTITITPDSQVVVSPATLTFTAANWNTPQNVTVTAVDDSVIESNHFGAISHGLTSGDPSFGGLPVDGVTVSIYDNDFNTAPVLTTIPPQTAAVGSLLTFTATATDNDLPANALTYTLIGAPGGAGIVASTGVFSWTPTPAQTGVFQFAIEVSDGTLADEQLVTITVADPLPSAAADADQDGLSDLLEHAFVTDAGVPNGNPFKVTGASGGTATLSFPWRWQAANITWRIRHGQDPSNTAAWPVAEPLATQATRDGAIDHMTITLPMNHPGRGFYILEVIGN
jgi:hypothetical protein